jgi:hypothetical protein
MDALGLPPLPPETIALVDAWIRQARGLKLGSGFQRLRPEWVAFGCPIQARQPSPLPDDGGCVARGWWVLAVVGLVACVEDDGRVKKRKDCGVDGGRDFRVRVVDAFIFPYKPESEEPWDWDGSVPDWLLELTDTLAYVLASPELETTAKILQIVDDVAPLILEGTVPPDPVLNVNSALQTATTTSTSTFFGGTTWTYTYGTYTFATDDTEDDTYEPRFDRTVPLELSPVEDLWIDLYDEDLAFDDYIGSAVLDLRDLRRLARCGVTRVRGLPGTGVYSVAVEVTPR